MILAEEITQSHHTKLNFTKHASLVLWYIHVYIIMLLSINSNGNAHFHTGGNFKVQLHPTFFALSEG